jgi:7,8-dihydropterin-6-yl-methyl-4-(beta-D-ribofuranosyl)aminobenzene 5'-phosphate synthase
MTVRITTLSENTAQLGFLGEWGLSILVETESSRVLLDTGLSTSAVYNADLMGIDFSTIDAIVLSHAHGDHTGGLRNVLMRARKQVQIIAHPDIWIPKYVVYGELSRYAGIPYVKEDLESLGASFNLTRKPFKISDDIMTTGEIEMTTDYETIDDRLAVKKGQQNDT